MKVAVISGVTGQCGSYLAELLLSKGYYVIGFSRRVSVDTSERIRGLLTNSNFKFEEGDICDPLYISSLLAKYRVAEFYNLAAQSVSEDSILPIKIGTNNVKHLTFKEIWDRQISKGNTIQNEDFNGTNIEVININPTKNSIKALGHCNSAGNWFNITQISRHLWKGKVAKLSQKFGSVTVTPNHSLIDIYGNVCEPESNPWMLNIRKVNSIVKSPIKSIKLSKEWTIEEDDIEDLCRFVGAFVTEGHTSYNKANRSYTTNISEQSKEWLEKSCRILEKLGLRYHFCTHKKDGYQDVYRVEINSKKLYNVMRRICGKDSYNKMLPEWFTKLSQKHSKILFDTMIEGDGCRNENKWRYTTSSYKLSCQFSWLITYLKYEYTVNEEYNEKYNKNYWHFRNCDFYQLNQGESGKKIQWLDYDGYVYDITVDEVHNFTVGVGNIVVHNSHVATSFSQPVVTTEIDYMGPLNILNAIKIVSPETKFYQASTSEMFGSSYDEEMLDSIKLQNSPQIFSSEQVEDLILPTYDAMSGVIKFQDENTKMVPQSPYAIAKLGAHHAVRLYRESYGLFASSGILFNNESPRRGEKFVTRKITKWIGEFISWKSHHPVSPGSPGSDQIYGPNRSQYPKLRLGNLEASRDWGHSRDYVKAMWMMLQHDTPDDYVVATGKTRTIRDFLTVAFNKSGIDHWDDYVVIDPEFYRPCEVDYLLGRADKIKRVLGWVPETSFEDLVLEMVEGDVGNNVN